MKKVFYFFLTTLGFTACNSQDTGTPKDLASFIKAGTDSVFKNADIPGILIGVLNNNKRAYYTAGFANPETKMPFDSATIFEIGSITKTFTAYVLMAVLMENKITETASILKFLPDSVQQNKNLERITFLSLMNHTSGLPRLPDNMAMIMTKQPYESYAAEDLFSYLKACTPKADGQSSYSNLGAGLAGVLAERISGKTYSALLDQYIFAPFKMNDLSNASTQNKSVGYFAKNDKAEYWNMNVLTPAGGIHSSANEILTYLQHMALPKSDSSKAMINKLTTQTVSINPKVAVGLGWHILTEKDQEPIYWHNGGTYGFSTFCGFIKGKSKAVVVVINQFNMNNFSDELGIKTIKRLLSEE